MKIINENIPFDKFEIIEGKEKLGLYTKEKALELAEEKGLDLVLVNENPCLVKLIDVQKVEYEEKKKRKLNKSVSVKEMQFGLNIAMHDIQIKMKKVLSFLEDKHPVVILIKIKGRETKEAGLILADKLIPFISEYKYDIDSKDRNITIKVK